MIEATTTTTRIRPSVTIAWADLCVVSEAMTARLPLRASEARRVQRLREGLAASAELIRALSDHTQHGLVHCQGSHGISDFGADTARLFDALSAWGQLVNELASEYRGLALPDVQRDEDSAVA